MNNELMKLQSTLAELTTMRNSTTVQSVMDLLDSQIDGVKKEMAKLSPHKDIATDLTETVMEKAKFITDADLQRYDDLHPRVAIKSINGAAFSIIRSILFLNRAHEAIMAKNVTSVSGTSGWKRVSVENTSPYEVNEEDRIMEINEEVKSCVAELATLFACWNLAVVRAEKEGVKIDLGQDVGGAGYDNFPDVAAIMRSDEARAVSRAAQNRAKGAAVRAVTPNVIALMH